ARRREPSDGVLVGQLFFHGLMIVPVLATLAAVLLRIIAGPAAAGAVGPLTRQLILIIAVAIPVLFTTLVGVLAHDLTRPDDSPDLAWTALLADQAAFVVVLV